jgi:hypothetical protein
VIEEREEPQEPGADELEQQGSDDPDASELDQEPDYNPDPESGPGKLKGG